jgi:magnesium transporter
LLKVSRNTRISELMNCEFKSVDTHTELDDLAFIFKQYALTIVPVTNRQGKLVGSISIDNMLYIIEEQTKSEFMHLGGVHNSDIFNNLYATAKHRFPWLFVNLVTACITSMVINQFSDTIAKLITLAIMPIVASMGGNAGTQAMTVTVRALAGREINNSNTTRVICKEILVCILNGLFLASIGMILIYLLFADISLSVVFASAVTINFMMAGLLGSSIPIILNRFDIDPAAASGVFLTAFTDAIGFFSFLGLAFFFLV